MMSFVKFLTIVAVMVAAINVDPVRSCTTPSNKAHSLASEKTKTTTPTAATLPDGEPISSDEASGGWIEASEDPSTEEKDVDEKGAASPTNNEVVQVQALPNQSITPQPPAPVVSTCGHSKYYYATNNPGAGIVGGVVALQNQYPWIARLSIRTSSGSYLCGGSVISKNYILTAAHCIVGASGITAYLGDHNYNAVDTGEISVTAKSWKKHSSYSSRTNDYDYALVQLSKNLTFTSWTIQPICLPLATDTSCTTAGSVVYIAGWGTTSESGSIAQYLRSAYVQIGAQTTCKTQYSYLTDRMTCAGYPEGGVDTCQGDSGGPLMSNAKGYYTLCGLTSFGNGCARANYYGVYSRIPVTTILTWIKTNARIP